MFIKCFLIYFALLSTATTTTFPTTSPTNSPSHEITILPTASPITVLPSLSPISSIPTRSPTKAPTFCLTCASSTPMTACLGDFGKGDTKTINSFYQFTSFGTCLSGIGERRFCKGQTKKISIIVTDNVCTAFQVNTTGNYQVSVSLLNPTSLGKYPTFKLFHCSTLSRLYCSGSDGSVNTSPSLTLTANTKAQGFFYTTSTPVFGVFPFSTPAPSTKLPTFFPTNSPTNVPTTSPTTVIPTISPSSVVPTASPTTSPTPLPTSISPTKAPTFCLTCASSTPMTACLGDFGKGDTKTINSFFQFSLVGSCSGVGERRFSFQVNTTGNYQVSVSLLNPTSSGSGSDGTVKTTPSLTLTNNIKAQGFLSSISSPIFTVSPFSTPAPTTKLPTFFPTASPTRSPTELINCVTCGATPMAACLGDFGKGGSKTVPGVFQFTLFGSCSGVGERRFSFQVSTTGNYQVSVSLLNPTFLGKYPTFKIIHCSTLSQLYCSGSSGSIRTSPSLTLTANTNYFISLEVVLLGSPSISSPVFDITALPTFAPTSKVPTLIPTFPSTRSPTLIPTRLPTTCFGCGSVATFTRCVGTQGNGLFGDSSIYSTINTFSDEGNCNSSTARNYQFEVAIDGTYQLYSNGFSISSFPNSTVSTLSIQLYECGVAEVLYCNPGILAFQADEQLVFIATLKANTRYYLSIACPTDLATCSPSSSMVMTIPSMRFRKVTASPTQLPIRPPTLAPTTEELNSSLSSISTETGIGIGVSGMVVLAGAVMFVAMYRKRNPTLDLAEENVVTVEDSLEANNPTYFKDEE